MFAPPPPNTLANQASQATSPYSPQGMFSASFGSTAQTFSGFAPNQPKPNPFASPSPTLPQKTNPFTSSPTKSSAFNNAPSFTTLSSSKTTPTQPTSIFAGEPPMQPASSSPQSTSIFAPSPQATSHQSSSFLTSPQSGSIFAAAPPQQTSFPKPNPFSVSSSSISAQPFAATFFAPNPKPVSPAGSAFAGSLTPTTLFSSPSVSAANLQPQFMGLVTSVSQPPGFGSHSFRSTQFISQETAPLNFQQQVTFLGVQAPATMTPDNLSSKLTEVSCYSELEDLLEEEVESFLLTIFQKGLIPVVPPAQSHI